MKPALRAALGGGKVSAGVCVTIGNLNELISVGLGPIFGGARLRFYVGLYAVQLGHPGRYLQPPIDRMKSSLRPVNEDTVVTGVYKDDDEKYSLQRLLSRQEEGER